MAKLAEDIFKKGYTEFDARLDRELAEEKEERRKQLLMQAPDYKLLKWMTEQGGEESEGLLAKLKDAGYYYLRSHEEDEADKLSVILYKALAGHPALREEMLKQGSFFGCLAFKSGMPTLGLAYADMMLEDLTLLGNDSIERVNEGYLLFKNVVDTAIRTRNEEAFKKLVNNLCLYWQDVHGTVTDGLLKLLSGLLFMAADRRQGDALKKVCRLSRSVLCHPSADFPMQQRFLLEWSAIVAQIAQREWAPECEQLLKEICLSLAFLKNYTLIKTVMADISLHVQMQSKWDDFESAYRLYYPCQLFVLGSLQWLLRHYMRMTHKEAMLDADAGITDSVKVNRLEQKIELIHDKNILVDMIRFFLRNARDMAAACARLAMKDEWEIYLSWYREGLLLCGRGERSRQRFCRYMQFVAEYWRCTQPSKSCRQWEKMAEVLQPPLLSEGDRELIELLA